MNSHLNPVFQGILNSHASIRPTPRSYKVAIAERLEAAAAKLEQRAQDLRTQEAEKGEVK